MHCLTVTYPVPDDPARFRDYYLGTHLPLAKSLPGLVSSSHGFPEQLGPGDAPFCVFHAYFADRAAMDAALESEVGARLAADVPNYSPKGASLSHHMVENH
jgi:uncharacterized protein (TIGR02118 family)